MNISRYLAAGIFVAAVAFVGLAPDTYACPVKPKPAPKDKGVVEAANWTSLDLRQSQWVEGNKTNVTMKQSGVTKQATFLGDHAMSSSKNFAEQALSGCTPGQCGGPTKANQDQRIIGGARTEFQPNRLPSLTTAGTMGHVIQGQDAWSAFPLNMQQSSGTEQTSKVGEAKSVLQGQEHQVLKGATGDPFQRQDLRGSSQAQGYTSLPFPQIFNLGSTFEQIVDFNVRNIFSF